MVRGRDVTVGEPGKKAPALCNPDRGIDDCFSRKSMNLAILDAEDIALQMEGPSADDHRTEACMSELRLLVSGIRNPQVLLLQKFPNLGDT